MNYLPELSELSVWDCIETAADARPSARMLVDDHDRDWSFAEYRDACCRVAARLTAEGIGPDSTVSWQLPTTIEAVVLLGALARLGARQNPLIPVLRRAELRPILEDVQPDLIVVPTLWRNHDHAEMAADLAADSGARVWALDLDGDLSRIELEDLSLLPAPPAADVGRWIYSTSGSTARPKTVLHTDASVLASSRAQLLQLDLGPEDLFPVSFPIAHIGGMAWLATSWCVGTQLMLDSAFDPAQSPLRMSRHGATVLGSATPFFLSYLSAQRLHGSEPLFPRLRFCMGGGAPIPSGLHAQVSEELGGLGVFNGYGLTECPILGYPTPGSDPELIEASAFVPAPGVEVRIVDADGNDVPEGQQGELRAKGPQSFLGYLDPELTSAAVDEAGYVHTGDLAILENGYVRVSGRIKDVIIRNGENISAIEIETAIAGSAGVSEVAVVGVPDARHGERVCAVVVPSDATDPPHLPQLVAACEHAELARFKFPEQLRIVDHLPRSPMGKLVKPAILDIITRQNSSSAP